MRSSILKLGDGPKKGGHQQPNMRPNPCRFRPAALTLGLSARRILSVPLTDNPREQK